MSQCQLNVVHGDGDKPVFIPCIFRGNLLPEKKKILPQNIGDATWRCSLFNKMSPSLSKNLRSQDNSTHCHRHFDFYWVNILSVFTTRKTVWNNQSNKCSTVTKQSAACLGVAILAEFWFWQMKIRNRKRTLLKASPLFQRHSLNHTQNAVCVNSRKSATYNTHTFHTCKYYTDVTKTFQPKSKI